MNQDYYVYGYYQDGKIIYVGKGRADRYRNKKHATHNYPLRQKLKKPVEVVFLKKGLYEEEAFKYEVLYIKLLGRIDLGTGPLYNLTEGGEGSSGVIVTEETRRKISKANKGKVRSAEAKANCRKAALAKKPMSEETKAKMSKAQKGKVISEETRAKIREARTGVPRTQATKDKIGAASRRMWAKIKEKQQRGNPKA